MKILLNFLAKIVKQKNHVSNLIFFKTKWLIYFSFDIRHSKTKIFKNSEKQEIDLNKKFRIRTLLTLILNKRLQL